MRKKWIIFVGVVLLVGLAAVVAFASSPVKLIVDGQEIKPDVAPQIINGRTVVPLRWVAEALGADVFWDEHANAVRINSSQDSICKLLSKEQIETLIQIQGKHKGSYYLEGLTYDFVHMDDAADQEIIAKIDGAVHLGNFFIFGKDANGNYKLITEQGWKVEEWDFNNPLEVDGHKLFKLVTRTGGTGLDIINVHFAYLKEGKFVEAWQGTLFERSAMFPEAHYKKVGGYQFDAEGARLYAWETTCLLEQDGLTPQGKPTTTTNVFLFDGEKFVPEVTIGSHSYNGDYKNSLLINEEFLSAAKQGRLNGIGVPLGTSKEDLLNILGEPNETGKIHIHTPYLKYANTTFYLKDDAVNVIDAKVEFSTGKIKELLGTPDLDGMSDAGTTEYIVGYDVEPYYLFFRYSSLEAGTGRLTFKNPRG